ncbi:MAG: MFS transporter [Anaerolineales bacterium]|jgi:predicted MFS family arabinose efflux permease
MKVRTQLIVIALLRVILNTMHRMVYPFLTVFAAGLGVSVTEISLALTGRNAVGIFGPILAPISDVRGRKAGMLSGIVLFTLGVGVVALRPNLITFSAALVLAILSKSMFDPAVGAYFGDLVPYAKRGTAIAITEMAWSTAFIVGVPGMGLLIAHYGWSAPFPVLAALGVLMLVVVAKVIPRDAPAAGVPSPLRNVREVLHSLPAVAGVLVGLWASAANEMVNLNFGVWLARSFGLQIAALAGASAVIGAAELGGESLVATITDRLGKPRAVAVGLTGNIAASLLLPLIGRTELGALAGLFLFYITFEYLVVSQIPMMTEVVPSSRATAVALNAMGYGIGRSLGALISTFVYAHLGFPMVTVTAALFNVLALLSLAEMERRIAVLPRLIAFIRRVFGTG